MSEITDFIPVIYSQAIGIPSFIALIIIMLLLWRGMIRGTPFVAILIAVLVVLSVIGLLPFIL